MATQTVKLSQETLAILKTAATINKSIAFKAGNEIKTVSASGSIVMESTVSETFPNDFAVYELPKLLGVLALPGFKDAELVFDDEVTTHLVIKAGSSKIKYFYSAEEFAQHPGKSIVLPKVDVEVIIERDTLENFEKAAAALGHKFIKFKVEGGKLFLIATDPKEDTSNDYIVEMGDSDADDFEAQIKLENLKLVAGDFKVQIVKMGKRGISRWEHLTKKIVTFIGLEMGE
jgi:hypothetical protein